MSPATLPMWPLRAAALAPAPRTCEKPKDVPLPPLSWGGLSQRDRADAAAF